MLWIGKVIATLAVWAGAVALGIVGLFILVGPVLAMIAGILGTMAIWCPEKLKG
jgi:hypothetical protein